ncbi:MAG: crotonobetainyl-CoA hydratase [Rhodospirillales bacterium]|nr:crotonobetainyl-CoA hydratase [Rhodospirillales bacterium]
MNDELKVTRNGQILEVTLDRPKANAIDAATSTAMGQVFSDFRDDNDLRVAILTGGGDRFFSAGWDLKAAAEGESYDSDYGVGGFGGINELFDQNKPVIVAMNGHAIGGGFELALAADIIIAADHVEMWQPEIFAGVIGDSGCFRLPRMIPMNIAKELLLTGRRMGTEEALRWGIINAAVPVDQLMVAAREMAETMIAAAPLALAATKETIRLTQSVGIEECYAMMKNGGLPMFDIMLASEDAQEGPQAFAEKRDPVWKGR